MKLQIRHGTLFALLLLSLVGFGQSTTGPYSFTGTACVSVSVDGQATIAMNISGGAWSGTIQPKAAIAGQAAANVQVTPSTSSTAASTITANGLYTATVAGYQLFQLCGNTVSGGNATVYFSTTQRSAGRGSGGGTPGGAAGGDLSGTYPNPTVVNINGTAFSGTNGRLVSFGAANIPADSGIVAADVVKATAPGVGLCHFAGSTQTCTSSAVNLAGADVTGVLPAANGGSIGTVVISFCQGAVGTGNATAYALAPANNASNNVCSVVTSNLQDFPMPVACTVQNLYVTASTAGAVVGSGVMAVAKNNSVQTLTCTLGTGTTCNDTTHSFSIVAGDRLRVQVTTGQASDTTANLRASFQCK